MNTIDCVRWDRAARNFHTSSIATDTSSHFDLAVHDLSKYQALVEQLKDAAIKIDLDVDNFPDDHPYRTNPRYSRQKLDVDVQNEESHLSHLEDLMGEHKEHRDRLTEVEEELWQLNSEGPGDITSKIPAKMLTETATAR